MKLTPRAKEAITESVMLDLAKNLNKSYSTIRRWIKDDSEMLTTINTVKELEKLTKLKQNQIFEDVDKIDRNEPFDIENNFIDCECKKPILYDRHLGDSGYDWCKNCDCPIFDSKFKY